MTTNDAFIKAYRHDASRPATPAPTQPPIVAAVRPATVAAEASIVRQQSAVGKSSSPMLWQSTVEIVAPIYDASTFAEVVAISPPNTLPLDAPRQAQSKIERPTAPAAIRREPVIGKRPLSSFITPESALPLPTAKTFHPETTIPSFRWPAVCRNLWQECAPQYERVADALAVHARNAGPGGSIFGVTGLQPGDGCTTTLLCLAIALATRKLRPILVDANFTSPQLANQLGVEPTASWDDVLERRAAVDEAVIHATRDGVDLLPLTPHKSPTERQRNSHFAAGSKSAATADLLRDAYDIALVDLGPLLVPAAFATISQLLQSMRIRAAVTVTNPNHATQDDLTVAGELLEEDGCQLLGIIENRSGKSTSPLQRGANN